MMSLHDAAYQQHFLLTRSRSSVWLLTAAQTPNPKKYMVHGIADLAAQQSGQYLSCS